MAREYHRINITLSFALVKSNTHKNTLNKFHIVIRKTDIENMLLFYHA